MWPVVTNAPPALAVTVMVATDRPATFARPTRIPNTGVLGERAVEQTLVFAIVIAIARDRVRAVVARTAAGNPGERRIPVGPLSFAPRAPLHAGALRRTLLSAAITTMCTGSTPAALEEA